MPTAKSSSAVSNKLFAHFKRLTKDEVRILTAFSVIYEPVNQTTMKSLLSDVGWLDATGKPLHSLMAKPLREELLHKGLLVRTQNGLICARAIVEALARRAVAEDVYAEIAQAGARVVPYSVGRRYWDHSNKADDNKCRQIRDGLYLKDDVALQRALQRERNGMDYSADLAGICLNSFDPVWFSGLSQDLQYQVLSHSSAVVRLYPDTLEYRYLEDNCLNGMFSYVGLRCLLAGVYIAQGRLKDAGALLPPLEKSSRLDRHSLLVHASLMGLRGDYTAAIPLYQKALKAMRKEAGNNKLLITGLPGLNYILALFASDLPVDHKALEKQVSIVRKNHHYTLNERCYIYLFDALQVLAGVEKIDTMVSLREWFSLNKNGAELLFFCLVRHWLGEAPADKTLHLLAEHVLLENAEAWVVFQGLALLRHCKFKASRVKGLTALMKADEAESEFASILFLLQPQQPWERALQALQGLNQTDTANTKNSIHKVVDKRLVWCVSESYHSYDLQPKEQKLGVRGAWSKGRNVALARLFEAADEVSYLTEEDRKICRCIAQNYDYYGSSYDLPIGPALQAAAGHPRLFWEETREPLEIILCEPQLVVQELGQQLWIQLSPKMLSEDWDLLLEREGSARLRMTEFSSQHLQIGKILGPEGIKVPITARDQVLQSISAIAPLLSIQSDIGGGDMHATEVSADTQLYMQIQPHGDTLRFDLAVQPLGVDGPHFKPGDGRTTVMTEVKGELLQTARDLEAERQNYQNLLSGCAILAEQNIEVESCEWHLEGESSLEALYQLQGYQRETEQQLQLLWPKGGQLKLGRESGVEQMNAQVRREQDWFALEGELQLDDGQVLSMTHIMALMEASTGRFVKLDDSQFITLTEQLRQRLQALSRNGVQQHYHPLALTALEELTDGMSLDSDEHWQQQKQRIEKACALQPQVPATLQAELRDYQQEGFVWLSQLAHWGAGACLADDMGLGKTMQALALILTRAADGPTLILAPTSVCMNWLSETLRFAPTLAVKRFGDGDRQAQMDNAGPFDVIVCSYGLLQTEQELLQSVEWQTIVADEAQALKNPLAKRTQAALSLNAKFKMVATGTPIENHLGELWSLFRFINPGLLGSLDSFNKRFAGPIEVQDDKLARQHLKRLVQPFILRRLKTEVLTELPPRTEITITVPQTAEEKVFYEAVRRQAIETLAASDAKPGQQQLKVLAEIMRLRRACCNAQLVMPESDIASSKLQAFGEIVDELRENKHRALVFSQFVGHLSLIREFLDKRDISYQYLDGSTSIKKREKAVNSFQAGEGDLFLISLKAGGSGLNLTAADYVIHMDPWWNPAVEDQASDRAHRMGQKRPVTIYRLVAEHTIEQKILAMHSQKRDLADSLLEGSDMSGKLSAKEIMGLIADAN